MCHFSNFQICASCMHKVEILCNSDIEIWRSESICLEVFWAHYIWNQIDWLDSTIWFSCWECHLGSHLCKDNNIVLRNGHLCNVSQPAAIYRTVSLIISHSPLILPWVVTYRCDTQDIASYAHTFISFTVYHRWATLFLDISQ